MHILFIEIETNESMHINQKIWKSSIKISICKSFSWKIPWEKKKTESAHTQKRDRKKKTECKGDGERKWHGERDSEKERKWERERMVNMKRIFESYGNCTLHDTDFLTWEHIEHRNCADIAMPYTCTRIFICVCIHLSRRNKYSGSWYRCVSPENVLQGKSVSIFRHSGFHAPLHCFQVFHTTLCSMFFQ